VDARERLYLGVIDECPDTEAAQEALWSLAGLYLDDFDEPEETKAQEVLEYFIKKYPDSSWIPHVENRLLWLYEGTNADNQTGRPDRVLSLFERILRREMPLSIRLPLELRCAQAYERAKQPDRAAEWYARIVKEAASTPEAETAKSRLAALKRK